ncbi:MAG TPA: proline dehydrogenase family protein, partial [Gaiellaceae bacterium]|nr:proline dehydrogenase family protein [Gaiellaceae bacterium]
KPLNSALRRAILAAVASRRLRGLVDRYGMRLGAARFVAGETLDDCLDVLAALNAKGLKANTTILGEGVTVEAETAAVVAEYERILERIAERRLRANLAVKLTHLGLEIDEELAFANVLRVVDRAGELGNFVRIDMEQSALVDATLRVYRRLREEGRDNVGAVLQSYLRRSEADLQTLLPLEPNLRIVKGAYLEPATIAYPRKEDVDAAYSRLVEAALRDGAYVAAATHDERLIEHVIAHAEREGLGRDRFELQMLYGVRPQLQLDLVRRGYAVLVATPFGPDWYPYLMGRLAERPANLLFVLRNLVHG